VKTTLEKWAQAQYGDNSPTVQTLRRWVREEKIFPLPQKHGRRYFVEETACYVGDFNDPAFLGSIRDASQTQ
jgi:predicted site-specific integrase-resolvase